MGSTLSVYVSNKYNSEYSLEIALVDEDDRYASSLNDFERDCGDSLSQSHSYKVLNSSSKLYYYSVLNQNVSSFLKKAEKYYPLVEKLNVVGNHDELEQIKEKFDESNVNYVDDDFVLGDGLREVKKLVNFSFSLELENESEGTKKFVKRPHQNISEDVLVVLLEEGVTYYLVPVEGETKYLGHSPMGPVTVTTIFRRYVRNFELKMKGFEKYREYNLDQVVELSQKGDYAKCDILVLDIYGGGYDLVNLPPSLPASRFGKLQTPDMKELFEKNGEKEWEEKTAKPEDFATSLVMMFVDNISQNVVLRSRTSKLNRVLLVGRPMGNDKLSVMVKEKIHMFWKEIDCLFSQVVSVKPLVAALNAKNS